MDKERLQDLEERKHQIEKSIFEVQKKRVEVDADIKNINSQLLIFYREGEKPPHSHGDWEIKARYALGRKKNDSKRLSSEHGNLKSKLKKLNVAISSFRSPGDRTFERQFMVEAKNYLPENDYNKIIEITKKILSNID